MLASPYSSEGTQADARAIARNLDARLIELRIERAMEAFDTLLAPVFDGAEPDSGNHRCTIWQGALPGKPSSSR